jgi:protein-disulfide isomerase
MIRRPKFTALLRAALALLILLLACISCFAQSSAVPPSSSSPASSDLATMIERQVRSHYSVPPDVKVTLGPLRSSEFPNYDALTVTFSGATRKQDFDFLLSHDHKTLMRVTRMDLTTDPYVETMKKIDVTGRPVRGNKDAKVKVVSFDDFQCQFCSRMHSTLFPGLFKEYGDRVAFIYKDYPLEEIHHWAVHAAVDANCLGSQNGDAYWDFADYVHSNQHVINVEKGADAQNSELDKLATVQGQKHNIDMPKLQACLKAQDEKSIRASMREGEAVGVDATPAVFINGQKLDGAVPKEEVQEALDRALKQAGVSPPEHKSAGEETKTPPSAPMK